MFVDYASSSLSNGSSTFPHTRLCYLNGDARNESYSFYAVTISASVITAIFAPVAVVGNALIMAVIWKNRSLRTPSYIFLWCLAFTDLCTGLITQPLQVTANLICLKKPQAIKEQLLLLRIFRGIVEGSASFFTTLTLILITLMSVERWLHMTRRSLLTVRRTFMIVTVVSLLLIPFAVFRLLYFLNGNYETFYYVSSSVPLLVCLLITTIAYFKVYRVIRRHHLQIKESETSHNFGRRAVNLAKYKKSVFLVLYILVVFYISYVPIFVTIIFSVFSYYHSVLESVQKIFGMLWLLSSSINPLIYLWRMNDIRNGVINLLKPLFFKRS